MRPTKPKPGHLRTRHGLDKWTTLEEAEPLSRLVNDARSHWTDLSEGGTKPAPEPATGADRRKPPQLRADIEALFERIRAMETAAARACATGNALPRPHTAGKT